MAGFFGLFDHSKPGKGVSKDERQKSRFLFFWELFFRKFWKLIQLNLLYIAFCLPIVTVGPATAGFIYVLRNMANEKPVFLFSDFWDGLKNNARQSFLYSLMILAATILLNMAWRFYYSGSAGSPGMYIPLMLCVMLAVMIVFISFYVFLFIVTIDLPLYLILKNSAILSIACVKTNLCTLFFIGLVLAATKILLPISALFFIFITPALIGFIICFNSYPGIKKYAIDPFSQAQEQENVDILFEDKP